MPALPAVARGAKKLFCERRYIPSTSFATARRLHCCRELGIPAEELRVDPRPVTPQLLQHSQQIDARLAVDIVAALRAEGLIDEVRRRGQG